MQPDRQQQLNLKILRNLLTGSVLINNSINNPSGARTKTHNTKKTVERLSSYCPKSKFTLGYKMILNKTHKFGTLARVIQRDLCVVVLHKKPIMVKQNGIN